METDLTFEKALKIAQGLEAAEGCAKEMKGETEGDTAEKTPQKVQMVAGTEIICLVSIPPSEKYQWLQKVTAICLTLLNIHKLSLNYTIS